MESLVLVKVNYGETLRRFCVPGLTRESGLGMDRLRTKIRNLFNIPSNFYLRMAYVDGDGDVVALVDEDDVYDITRQKLKCLRIDVELAGEMNKHPHSGRETTNQSGGRRKSQSEPGEIDTVSKDCESSSTAPAASTPTESHPVSVAAPPPLVEQKENLLRRLEKKSLARVGKIRDVLYNDHYMYCAVDPLDQHKWNAALDAFKEMGFNDPPEVERLLQKNGGNMGLTLLVLLATEMV